MQIFDGLYEVGGVRLKPTDGSGQPSAAVRKARLSVKRRFTPLIFSCDGEATNQTAATPLLGRLSHQGECCSRKRIEVGLRPALRYCCRMICLARWRPRVMAAPSTFMTHYPQIYNNSIVSQIGAICSCIRPVQLRIVVVDKPSLFARIKRGTESIQEKIDRQATPDAKIGSRARRTAPRVVKSDGGIM